MMTKHCFVCRFLPRSWIVWLCPYHEGRVFGYRLIEQSPILKQQQNSEVFMSLAQRIDALKEKHAVVDRELVMERLRPSPDTIVLRRLKREKLRIKDEIEKLREH